MTKIKNLTKREAQSRLDEIQVRMLAIADACERENRAQTDEEAKEVKALEREAADLKLDIALASMPAAPVQTYAARRCA